MDIPHQDKQSDTPFRFWIYAPHFNSQGRVATTAAGRTWLLDISHSQRALRCLALES